jgi:hypothetical protein
MISRHVKKGNIKAVDQVLKVIGWKISAAKDKTDPPAFFSKKIFL